MRSDTVGAQAFATLHKSREILQAVKAALLTGDVRDDLHEVRLQHAETQAQKLVDDAITEIDLALVRLRQASAALLKSRSSHLGRDLSDAQLPAWLRAAARARAVEPSGKTAKR